MPDVRLSESDQRVLHSLLSLEAVPGEPLPSQQAFEMLNRLVRCDSLGAVYSDLHGRITRAIDVMPRGAHTSTLDTTVPSQVRSEHDGPFYLGVMHWREHPAQAEHCGHLGEPGDGVCIGFRNGTDAIVQYGFHRDDQMFTRPRPRAAAHDRTGSPATGARAPHSQAPLDHHADRAPCAQPRRRGPEQRPDRRDAVHLGRHGPQAPRARVPKARCEQQCVGAVARLRGCDEPTLDLRGRLDRYA